MAKSGEFLTEERLKKGIWIVSIAIAIVAVGILGYWFYLNRPPTAVPEILQTTIKELEKKVKENPNSLEAHAELGQLYLQSKRYDDAIDEGKTILKISKDNSFGNALLGMAYEAKGKTKTAIDYYKKAIERSEQEEMKGLNPALTESTFRLGKIYMDQKKYDEALELFQKSVSYNTIDSDARYNLGLVYLRQKKYDEAIEQFNTAVKFVPDYYQAWYRLGEAHEKKKNEKEAIEAYENALKYNEDYKEAKEALDRLK